MDRSNVPDLWVRRVCANLPVSSVRRRLVELRAVTRLAARRDLPSLSEESEEFSTWSTARRATTTACASSG